MGHFKDSLGNVMNCETVPDYDSWLPLDTAWIAGDWITFHQMLMEDCDLTPQQATDRVSQLLDDRALFGDEWFFGFDNNFVSYFEGFGADFGYGFNIVNGVAGGVENAAVGVFKVGKTFNWLVPAAVVGVAIYYGIKAYKTL